MDLKKKYLNICRICETNRLLIIDLSKEPNCLQMFLSFANIQFDSQDLLPKHLCETCYISLETCFKFKIQCEQADTKFRKELLKETNSSYLPEVIAEKTNINELSSIEQNGIKTEATEIFEFIKVETADINEVHLEVENKTLDPINHLDNSLHIGYTNREDSGNLTNEDNLQNISSKNQENTKIKLKKKSKRKKEKKETKKSIRKKTCTLCNVFIKDLSEFMAHKKAHIADTGFKCLNCEKEFRKKPSLRHHSRAIHQGILFNCKQCNKSFSKLANLHRHVQTIHKLEKNFVCEQCGNRFAQFTSLQEHFLCIHSNVKQFQCDMCQKYLKSKRATLVHMRYHHMKSLKTEPTKKRNKTYSPRKIKVKYISCPVCFKDIQNVSLNIHMRIHKGIKPHTCDICGKAFRQKNHLTRHLLWHTGLKTHKCMTCGKSFATQSSLRIHTRYHTGEKRYKCVDCSKAFTVINDLKRHWKKEHAETNVIKCTNE